MRQLFIYLLTLIGILVLRCTEPVDIGIFEYEKTLVIDGRISDDPEQQNVVKLFYTRPVNTEDNEPLTGALVRVQDQNGNSIALEEEEEGSYLTPSDFLASPGNSYQLFITTTDGKNYESDMTTLKAAPPIESIYSAYSTFTNTSTNTVEGGLQFYFDSPSDEPGPNYYRYEWDDTYEIQVPYPSRLTYDVQNQTFSVRDE